MAEQEKGVEELLDRLLEGGKPEELVDAYSGQLSHRFRVKRATCSG